MLNQYLVQEYGRWNTVVNSIKTIINGIKCWVTDSISKLSSNIRNEIENTNNNLRNSIKETTNSLDNRIQTLENKQDFKQVQGDWLQNDKTAVDYVKNRPGGYSELKNVNIFTITYTMTSGSNNQNVTTPNEYISESYNSINLYEDYSGTYQVLPRRYIPEYTLQESSVYGYGNSKLCGYGADTGEQYFIVYADNKTQVYCKPNDSIIGRTITLKGYVEKNVPKTFDSSYMPIISERFVGCGKAELISDTSTVSSQYSKIFATEDGTLYSGKTLPGTGNKGQVPVFTGTSYELKSFGKLGGGEQSSNFFDYKLSDNTTDVVFILNSKTTTDNYYLYFQTSGDRVLPTVRIKFDSANGSTVIHINRIVEGYISYRVYNGEVIYGGSENNFMECKELNYIRLSNSGGNIKFTVEMYGN